MHCFGIPHHQKYFSTLISFRNYFVPIWRKHFNKLCVLNSALVPILVFSAILYKIFIVFAEMEKWPPIVKRSCRSAQLSRVINVRAAIVHVSLDAQDPQA